MKAHYLGSVVVHRKLALVSGSSVDESERSTEDSRCSAKAASYSPARPKIPRMTPHAIAPNNTTPMVDRERHTTVESSITPHMARMLTVEPVTTHPIAIAIKNLLSALISELRFYCLARRPR